MLLAQWMGAILALAVTGYTQGLSPGEKDCTSDRIASL